jgi:galactokinase
MINQIKLAFEKHFSPNPLLVKSPGRVNLIGEHTDYNNGFVLPAAINKYVYFAIKPNGLNEYRFFAYDLKQGFSTASNKIELSHEQWANYLLGVIAQMVNAGKRIPGFDCVFGGNIPIGAGMSSSAAIECGLAYSLNEIFNLGFNKMEMAKLAQRAEHEYAGVKCGIMDQFAVLFGKENHAIKLDCQSLKHEYYELDMNHLSIILVNTGVKHSLASSEYNKRRSECQKGVDILKKYNSNILSLRDVNSDVINLHKQKIEKVTWNRCSYVVEENDRVQLACDALVEKDFVRFGELMYQSHYGLRDKYEVSCPELDRLVELTEPLEGVLGARMMGGGFGGCTINLVRNEFIDDFIKIISSNYRTPNDADPEIFTCNLQDGTKIV